MKSTISHVIILCILCCSTISNAQEEKETKPVKKRYSNSVKLLLGDFTFNDRGNTGRSIAQQGLYYERKIYRNLYAGLGYTHWYALRGIKGRISQNLLTNAEYQNYEPIIGRIERRFNYKMADVYLLHRFYVKKSNHALSASVGMSYSWGENFYLATHYFYSFEPHGTYKNIKADYYGFIPGIAYDYSFLKNRLVVGANFRARFYSGRPESQYDYGIHVGVNF